jgi:abortive infection bacteriophage resistance protein
MHKPFLTLDDQVALLSERGLAIRDARNAVASLLHLNYYRVSGYGRELQVAPSRGDESFRPGTSLERILGLMERDARLRSLLAEALAEIEIGVRSRFAYEAGRELGSRAFYLEPAAYLDITPNLPGHIAKIERELQRPRLRTVGRYRVGDDLTAVPIWVAIEVISFGSVAKTLWYLKTPSPAQRAADALGVQRSGFGSTVHSFAVLRNVCAHHGQLWHRSFDIMFATLPKEKRREPAHAPSSVYSGIVAAKRFLKGMGRLPDWPERVASLLEGDPEYRAGILHPAPR